MNDISLIDVEERPTVGIRRRVPVAELPAFLEEAFDTVAAQVEGAGAHIAGAPFARYRGAPSDVIDVEAGFPLTEPWSGGGDLVVGALPATRAVEATHRGSYTVLRETYEEIERWTGEHDVQVREESWELYEAGPSSDPDPGTWRTRIIWPVAAPEVDAG
ncbi:effector-binding domain-containing protein [Georgenia satyanarayanai]|uniref:Effector-binding domain-containing protein n=1 Tax=Georgenia satyanarayanai TaxID=860221 RepID=A0A2Y9A2R9_9MICO|nr:GyrI-like domain-containing protein [Georgenia satyanarayanai]PYG01647.1 effector-binding domain-containing protein [Georgenia satyanarayanai]SSA36447.1 effector-binding domain-containing protein [Georgenia satyanarayanai]